MEQKILSLKDDKINSEVELYEYPVELIGGRNLLSNNPTNWERGFFSYETGVETVNIAAIRTKGYIAINSEELTISLGDLDQRVNLFFFKSNKEYISNSGWKHADDSYTIITPSEAKYVRVAVGSLSLNYPRPSTISLWKTKLEKGNKATDWSPAPEDLGLSYPNWVTEFKPSISENGILAPEFDESGVLSFSINRTTAQEFIENPNL